MSRIWEIDKGSFRDPSGNVINSGHRILRSVKKSAADDFKSLVDSGLLHKLIDSGWLVDTKVANEDIETEAEYIVEHQVIDHISYPYEWGFFFLKRATLFHLDFHLFLLEKGYTLSDATAYNIQFIGTKPIFIDLLSIRKYKEGEYWLAHRQFTEQFLVPLLLRSVKGVAHNNWYRGNLEGIPLTDFYKMVPMKCFLSLNMIFHIILQAKIQNHEIKKGAINSATSKVRIKRSHVEKPFPKIVLIKLLKSLRKWISSLEPLDKTDRTVWSNYGSENTYIDQIQKIKSVFISSFVAELEPNTLWDLGCNGGFYSFLSLKSGAKNVVGFDFDQKVIDSANEEASRNGYMFQAFYLDAANESPAQGWRSAERKSFSERINANAVIALAFIHHLAIAKNIPLDQVINWIVSMAPNGVIEFVGKEDPTVKKMLQNRTDLFPNYNLENFISILEMSSNIIQRVDIPDSERCLVSFQKKCR